MFCIVRGNDAEMMHSFSTIDTGSATCVSRITASLLLLVGCFVRETDRRLAVSEDDDTALAEFQAEPLVVMESC